MNWNAFTTFCYGAQLYCLWPLIFENCHKHALIKILNVIAFEILPAGYLWEMPDPRMPGNEKKLWVFDLVDLQYSVFVDIDIGFFEGRSWYREIQ